MRKALYHLISTADTRVPADRVYQMGSVDEDPDTPFIVYRLSGTAPGVTKRHRSRVVRVEVWVHDAPGTYVPIEDDLTALEDRMEGFVHLDWLGDKLAQVDFETRSPDLYDDGFRTITKMSQFTALGEG